jgi:8-oxo-dGTP diphosphatase
VSYLAVVDRGTSLNPEDGQPVDWLPLDEPWQGWFSEDRTRMRRCAELIGDGERGKEREWRG